MSELHIPFAVYTKHDDADHYSLSEVYIHKVKVGVRQKMPNKNELHIDNQKIYQSIRSCWIAIFVDGGRCFSLTSHKTERVWLKKDYVMRFNPMTTQRTRDYVTNSVDLVVPLTSRLDCYCPVSQNLVSSTLVFSNYMPYPVKISMKGFDAYLDVFINHWNKVMKETVEKNKTFCLPPRDGADSDATSGINEDKHLSHNKQDVTKRPKTALDFIIKNIRDDQLCQYSRIREGKRKMCKV